MKRLSIALAALLAMSGAAFAHQFKQGDLVIKHPWTRATPNGASVGVGYVTITNNGKESDRLIGGTFDGAGGVEVHEMKIEGGKMIMRHLDDGLEIKPGETVELKPSSNHLMFTALKTQVKQDTNVKGSLSFAKAGTVEVEFKAESMGASTSSDDKHDEHSATEHGHEHMHN